MGSDHLPEGYLEFCSLAALESLVLSRMNQAAMLRTQAKLVLQKLVEAEAEVKVVCWVLEKRRSRESRHGRGAKIRSSAGPATLASANLLRLADIPPGSYNCWTRQGSKISLCSIDRALCTIRQTPGRISGPPVRAFRCKRVSLKVSPHRTHGENPCKTASPAQPGRRLNAMFSGSTDVETNRIVVDGCPRPAWHSLDGGTTKRSCHPKRTEKQHFVVLVRVVARRARFFEARSPTASCAIRGAALAPRRIRAAPPHGFAARIGLAVMTSSLTRAQSIQVLSECCLAFAS
jgi:hypothetical protein